MLKCFTTEMQVLNNNLVALKMCTRNRDLRSGMRIHKHVLENGEIANILVANALMDMYSKCGCMQEAVQIFHSMVQRDVISWTVIVMGYARNGEGSLALQVFYQMKIQGYEPSHVTLLAAIKACSSLLGTDGRRLKITRFKQIHVLAARLGYESNTFVGSALVDMYAKLGSIADAQKAFYGMSDQDVVAWTSMIQGYASNGQEEMALDYYNKMKTLGTVVPDSRVFVSTLKACAGLAGKTGKDVSFQRGKDIHAAIIRHGHDSNIFVRSMLMDMYAKCGRMDEARTVFDATMRRDVVSWTAIILGYAANGENELALQLYVQMQYEGCLPNHVTIVAAIKACTSLENGRALHLHACYLGHGCNLHVSVALVDMYCRYESMVEACNVFDGMVHKNIVAWTVIIQGYVRSGQNRLAMCHYSRLRNTSLVPDAVTFVATVKACGHIGDLESGKKVHADVKKHGFERNILVATSLVDFYGKCGCMDEAESAFALVSGDSVAWGALMAGYSRQGDVKGMVDAFGRMRDEGVLPNATIFLCILTACSHGGLVEQGKHWFETMWKEYGIAPGVDHYTCIIDMLARSNRLDEAVSMLYSMPFEPDEVSWTTVRKYETKFVRKSYVPIPDHLHRHGEDHCVDLSLIRS